MLPGISYFFSNLSIILQGMAPHIYQWFFFFFFFVDVTVEKCIYIYTHTHIYIYTYIHIHTYVCDIYSVDKLRELLTHPNYLFK